MPDFPDAPPHPARARVVGVLAGSAAVALMYLAAISVGVLVGVGSVAVMHVSLSTAELIAVPTVLACGLAVLFGRGDAGVFRLPVFPRMVVTIPEAALIVWLALRYRHTAIPFLSVTTARNAMLCVVVAGSEETWFRGIFFHRLRTFGVLPAALGNAVVFALMHGLLILCFSCVLHQMWGAFAFGLLATAYVCWTGSLWPPIVFHATTNFVVLQGAGTVSHSWVDTVVLSAFAVYGIVLLIFAPKPAAAPS